MKRRGGNGKKTMHINQCMQIVLRRITMYRNAMTLVLEDVRTIHGRL